MIKKTQRKQLLKAFKNRYTKGVIEILNEKKIFNKNGNSFSPGFISHVLNGEKEHFEVEIAIFEYYQKCVLKKQEMELKKQELLENKKPEAATSGN